MLEEDQKVEQYISIKIDEQPLNIDDLYLSQFSEEYRSIIGLSKTYKTSQIIRNFSKHRISYNQLKYDRPFRYYVEFFESLHHYFKVKVEWRCFDLELLIAEIQINNPLRQFQCCKGNFGEVYFTEYCSQQIAVKSFKFASEEQLQHKLPFIVRQWSIFKICSVLKCAPCLDSHFGFDLVIYNDCIQYASEAGKMMTHGLTLNEKQEIYKMLDLMHHFKIIHGDMKPQNFVYSNKLKKYVFIDFGFSQIIKQNIGFKTLTIFRGTPQFCSNQMNRLLLNPPDYIDLYYNDAIGLKRLFNVLQNLDFQQISLSYVSPWALDLAYQWIFMKFRYYYLLGDVQNTRNVILYYSEFLGMYIERVMQFIQNSMSVFFSISLFFEDLKPFKNLRQYKQIQKKVKQDLFGLFSLPIYEEAQTIVVQSKIRGIFAPLSRYSTGNNHNYTQYASFILEQTDNLNHDDEKIVQLGFECIRFDTLNVSFECKVKIAQKINRTVFITYPNQKRVCDLQDQKQMSDIRICLSSMVQYCMKAPLTWWKKQTIFDIFYQSLISESFISNILDKFLIFLKANFNQFEQQLLTFIYIRRFIYVLKHKQWLISIEQIIHIYQKMSIFIRNQIEDLKNIYYSTLDKTRLVPMQILICLNEQFSKKIDFSFLNKLIQSIPNKILQNNLLFISICRQIEDKSAQGSFEQTYQLFYTVNKNPNFKRICLHQYIHINDRVLNSLSKYAQLKEFKRKINEIIGCPCVSRNCDFLFQKIIESAKYTENAVKVVSQNFPLFSSFINLDLFLFLTIFYFKQFHLKIADETRSYLLNLFKKIEPFKITGKQSIISPKYIYHQLYYRIIMEYYYFQLNDGKINWPLDQSQLGLSQHYYQIDELQYSCFRKLLVEYYSFRKDNQTDKAIRSIQALMSYCNQKELIVLKFDIIYQLIDNFDQSYEDLRLIYEQCRADNYFFPYFRPEMLGFTVRTIVLFMDQSISIGYQFISDILNFIESHQYISYIAFIIRIMEKILQQSSLHGKFRYENVRQFFGLQLRSNSYVIFVLLLCLNEAQQLQNILTILKFLAFRFDYINSLFRNCFIYDYYMNQIEVMKNKARKNTFILLKLVKRFAPQKKLKEIFRKQLKSSSNFFELGFKKSILKMIQSKGQKLRRNDVKNHIIL